jgi:hypothetical protein
MTAKDNNRRSGPRERQTMSGILVERRSPLPPDADRAPHAYPPSVIVDQRPHDAIPMARPSSQGRWQHRLDDRRERHGR